MFCFFKFSYGEEHTPFEVKYLYKIMVKMFQIMIDDDDVSLRSVSDLTDSLGI